jgi:hypothetical protein
VCLCVVPADRLVAGLACLPWQRAALVVEACQQGLKQSLTYLPACRLALHCVPCPALAPAQHVTPRTWQQQHQQQTLAYLLPALTLALQRAEAAYRRRTAAATASAAAGGGRRGSREADQWTVQVSSRRAGLSRRGGGGHASSSK